ncbi:carbon starvation protein [Bifidobacterium choloepi]|nr:carbon starvation protein [Bifidobacterium choloepi]
MKLTTSSRARLYALTCLATVIWFVQSITQAEADGTLFSWSSIIFLLCLTVVIGYTGYSAVKDWNVPDPASTQQDDGSKDTDR